MTIDYLRDVGYENDRCYPITAPFKCKVCGFEPDNPMKAASMRFSDVCGSHYCRMEAKVCDCKACRTEEKIHELKGGTSSSVGS